MIQKTVYYIKANQVLTKEKTGVPGGIRSGQGREAIALDITATAPALFLALLFYRYYAFNSGLDESGSFKPGTLSQVDVGLIAHELCPSWKKVALALNLPDAQINEIEADESKVFERCYGKYNCVACIVVMG